MQGIRKKLFLHSFVSNNRILVVPVSDNSQGMGNLASLTVFFVS